MTSSSSGERSQNSDNEIIVHGVLVNVHGTGVLLIGAAGIGKSACALELVTRGHKLVADDVIVAKRQVSGTVIGSAPEAFAGILAVRALGAFDVRQLFYRDAYAAESSIDACIELRDPGTFGPFDPFAAWNDDHIVAGVPIPRLVLPAGGEGVATLIETAARLVQNPEAVRTAASFTVDG
jgi:HPr kinase/phosphorylase